MLAIKLKFGCVYHPKLQGAVECANGTIKAKMAKIGADSQYRINWVDALLLALMSMQSEANRQTYLLLHEMLMRRLITVLYLRNPYEGPSFEQCEREQHAVFDM